MLEIRNHQNSRAVRIADDPDNNKYDSRTMDASILKIDDWQGKNETIVGDNIELATIRVGVDDNVVLEGSPEDWKLANDRGNRAEYRNSETDNKVKIWSTRNDDVTQFVSFLEPEQEADSTVDTNSDTTTNEVKDTTETIKTTDKSNKTDHTEDTAINDLISKITEAVGNIKDSKMEKTKEDKTEERTEESTEDKEDTKTAEEEANQNPMMQMFMMMFMMNIMSKMFSGMGSMFGGGAYGNYNPTFSMAGHQNYMNYDIPRANLGGAAGLRTFLGFGSGYTQQTSFHNYW